MKEKILEILEKNSLKSPLIEKKIIVGDWFNTIADEILALSPWKKFDGKIDKFPCFLMWNNGFIDYVKKEAWFSDLCIIREGHPTHYMPVPPRPEEK